MLRYEIACATHPGRVRSNNEDAVLGLAELGLAVVADGMGGYAAGEVASRLAVDEIKAELMPALRLLRQQSPLMPAAELHDDLHAAAQRANTAIAARARRDAGCAGMGATLVMAVLQPGRISVAHLGDSRAYRWRAGRLELLTRDHCWLDEQIAQDKLSVDALLGQRCENIVTRALGVEDDIALEVHDHEARDDDVFLLCSDGLSDMLDAPCIAALLAGPDALPDKAQRLIGAANERGGRDNISVILLRQVPAAQVGWPRRLLRRLQGGE